MGLPKPYFEQDGITIYQQDCEKGMTEFGEYANHALVGLERKGSVCTFCGANLPSDYYLLLAGWRSQEKELVSPLRRFCLQCWEKIEQAAYTQVRQLQMNMI